MASKTPIETLHDIKRHLDNGFDGKQIANKMDISKSLVSRICQGKYGTLPEYPYDYELKAELRVLNLEKLNNKIRGRV